MNISIIFRTVLASLLFCTSFLTFSGVEIGGTRVVYNGDKSQTVITINNPDPEPYLIQSWVDKTLEKSGEDSTFITTPPLFRLEPHSDNVIRIIKAGDISAHDRESLYWLNIKIIPASTKSQENQLHLTFKTRMKLFYRPEGLKGDVLTAIKSVKFSNRAGKLSVSNDTPWYVSFHSITAGRRLIEKPVTLAPFSTLDLGENVQHGDEVKWTAITDYGGISTPEKTQL